MMIEVKELFKPPPPFSLPHSWPTSSVSPHVEGFENSFLASAGLLLSSLFIVTHAEERQIHQQKSFKQCCIQTQSPFNGIRPNKGGTKECAFTLTYCCSEIFSAFMQKGSDSAWDHQRTWIPSDWTLQWLSYMQMQPSSSCSLVCGSLQIRADE